MRAERIEKVYNLKGLLIHHWAIFLGLTLKMI